LCLLVTVSAWADDVADEADHLFTLGTERYAAGDYKGALQYFLASNRLVRNRNVMFNIARTYEHMKDYPDAYRYYQRAAEGETDPGAKQRIRDALARLAGSVGLLEVKTEPPGASIYLNRKDLGDRGTSPQTIALAPGQYTVIAELAGHQDAVSQPIDVRVGTERSVTLKLVRVVGMIRVSGVAGAQVRLDTEDSPALCDVPCDAPSGPGQHTVIVTKPGYRQGRYGVQVKANTITNLKADLEPETGSLVVNADERDAVIEIDGKTQGFTPAVLQVPAGKHTVRVTLRGFKPVAREVDMKVNEQTQLDLVLVTADSVEAASRVAEPLEDAPASVTLIPSPELRAMHYPTVAEAVRGIRGVYVSDDRSYKTVGFRGFGRPGDYGNRVLVLIDGQPANDNWLWSSYLGYDLRTDIEDIERIEVVRGPGSVLYGTGAFSGVINLVTNGVDAPDGREVGLSVADEGVARARARITHHFAKNVGVWTSVAAGRSAGNDYFFREWVTDSAPTVAGYARGVDDFKVATAQGRFFYDIFTVQWFFNTHDKAIPTGDPGALFGDARNRQTDTRAFLEAKVEPKVGTILTSTTRAHANYYGYRSHIPHDPANGGLERNAYDGAWVGAEQRFLLTPIDELRLTGGGEFQYHALVHEKTTSELDGLSFEQRQRFTLAAAYAMADVTPTKQLKASAAARYDSYSTSPGSLNPRLAVIVKPYDGGNVKVLAGKAFRAPSIYELYSSGSGLVSNPSLRPENMYSAEVEYSHRFSTTVVGTVSTYANYITDLIALRDLPAQPGEAVVPYRYENTDVPVGTLGGEAEIRRDWKSGWMVSASYSYQKSRYLKSKSITELLSSSGAPGLREVPNSPNHLASVRGGVPILGRALLLMNRLTVEGPRYDRNDVDAQGSPPQGQTSPALLWDVVFSGAEPRWGLTWSAGVYNAFDARWTVPISTEFRQTQMVQNGRTFLALGALTF
jgi:outer membrane receptor protein involved in Fe transport